MRDQVKYDDADVEGVETGSPTGTSTETESRIADRPAPAVPAPADQLRQKDPTRYEILGEHGRGGIGVVMEAFDGELDRTVALKELHRVSVSSEARFMREAKITARLEHPGIVPVHEAGRWPNGTPFYSMKLVSGRSLKELIAECATLEERLALIPNVLAVAEAIGYAHSERIIHRDLKPANVIVGEFGETVVIDWGLAKDLAEAEEISEEDGPYRTAAAGTLTVVGDVMGTPAYMAPEQARGENVDERADVYALGAMLFHVVVGGPPFVGTSSEEVIARVAGGIREPLPRAGRGLPAELIAIIEKAMSRAVEDRYSAGGEFAADVRRFLNGQIVSAHRYALSSLVRNWVRRHRAPVAVAAIAAAIVIIVGTMSLLRIVKAEERERAQRMRAEERSLVATTRASALVLEQARNALATDPTEALAWLKHYPADGDGISAALELGTRAVVQGAAMHVLRTDGVARLAQFGPHGRAVLGGKDGTVRIQSLDGARKLELSTGVDLFGARFSPDGKLIAVSPGESAPLSLWSAETGELMHELRGPTDASGFADFSPDGTLVAAGGIDNHVRVWDVKTGELVRSWSVDAATYEVRFLAEGAMLGAASKDGAVSFFELEDSEGPKWRAVVHAGPIWSLEPSPDLRAFVTAGADGVLRVWNVASRQFIELRGHAGEVEWAKFFPDGLRLLSIGQDRTVRVWDLSDRSHRVVHTHLRPPQGIAISADGSVFASSASDEVILFDARSGVEQTLRGHREGIYNLDFSPDGKWLISASAVASDVRVWPVERSGARVFRGHRAPVHSVSVSPSGRIATASHDRSIRVWKLEGELVAAKDAAHLNKVTQIYLAKDGTWMVSAADNATVRRWRLEPLEQNDSWQHPSGVVLRLAVSPDEHWVATATLAGTVVIKDLRTDELSTIAIKPGAPHALAFSPNSAVLAIAHAGGVSVWTSEGGLLPVIEGPSAFSDVAFSPDGTQLIATSSAKTVHLVELSSRAGDRVIGELSEAASTLSISPDGADVAVATRSGAITVLRVSDGRQTALFGHTDRVLKLVFSPDGKYLASASGDASARVWRLGDRASIVLPHGARVTDVEFSVHGEELVTSSYDHLVRVWPIDDMAELTLASTSRLRTWLDAKTTTVVDLGDPLRSPHLETDTASR